MSHLHRFPGWGIVDDIDPALVTPDEEWPGFGSYTVEYECLDPECPALDPIEREREAACQHDETRPLDFELLGHRRRP